MSALYCVVRESDGAVVGASAKGWREAIADALGVTGCDSMRDVNHDRLTKWVDGHPLSGYTLSLQPLAPGVDVSVIAAMHDQARQNHIIIGGQLVDSTREQRISVMQHILTAALSVDGRDG